MVLLVQAKELVGVGKDLLETQSKDVAVVGLLLLIIVGFGWFIYTLRKEAKEKDKKLQIVIDSYDKARKEHTEDIKGILKDNYNYMNQIKEIINPSINRT